MAETSYLWDNPGTGDSPALGYGNSLWNQVIFRMILNGTGDQGVLQGWLNELEVTDGGVDTATVDTGGAILYGVWYETDATVDIDINAYRGGNCLIIVRASWAAQTARVVARAVGALTQTAGVTYEIPLANVAINGAGAITLITDTRDYCEFGTDIWPLGITSDMLDADAVTIAKMATQARWIDRGSGTIEPDVANACTWTNQNFSYPYRDAWSFVDAAQSGGWITFRVPADIISAQVGIYVRTNRRFAISGAVRWCYSAWTAQPSAVLANSAGCTGITYTAGDDSNWTTNKGSLIGAVAVTAGDIVHVHVYRDGAHANDTLAETVFLHLIRIEYGADS